MKKCKKCKIDKLESEFHISKQSKDGLYSHCKSCKKEYDIEYRKTDKVINHQKSQEYKNMKRNHEIRKFQDNRYHMIQSAKARAVKYKIPFDIKIDDIIIPEYCPLLEIKLERKPWGKGGSFQPCSPSLDRIIPENGYVKNNIIVISMKANAMKYNATIEELEKFSKNLYKLKEIINDNPT